MTDEEMSKEYIQNGDVFENNKVTIKSVEQAFIAGLKAGRPKWHKVADGDFPKEGVEVLDKDGDKVIYDAGGSQGWIAYSEYCGRYVEVDEPIAWCEIPKYIEK